MPKTFINAVWSSNTLPKTVLNGDSMGFQASLGTKLLLVLFA